MEFVVACVIGVGFGFFLERGGFGNANKLAMQFYFRDLTVFKVMFTAIITAMVGLIMCENMGIVEPTQVWINPTYLWPGVVGGLIMGVGFILGGYCPGTSLVGGITGRTDALFYLGGILLGMAVFGEVMAIDSFATFFAHEVDGFTGKRLTLFEWLGMSKEVLAAIVVVGAVAAFIGAEWMERFMAGKTSVGTVAQEPAQEGQAS